MLKRLNPLSKLVVCATWLLASVMVLHAGFQIGIILAVCVLLMALNRTSPALVVITMIPFCFFGLGFITTSVLFGQESEFARKVAGETPFGSATFSFGIVLFLRTIACGMISAFFAFTTDPGAFVRALMAYARLPAAVGYALFAAMQLVPDLASEAQQMRLARAMKSGRMPRRFPGPVEIFSLIVPLLAFAIRRASRSAIAMEARGLGKGPRTITNLPRFSGQDLAFVALSTVLCAASMYAASR